MLKIYLTLLFFTALVSAAPYFNPITYVYKTVGDLPIELDVYVPPKIAPPQSGYPVFFVIHGGAYVFGHKRAAFTDQEFNETMDRGWVLVSIDYRLVPGVVFSDVIDDIQDAYDWVRSELIKIVPINPDLITIFGQSAGGGLANICGYKITPRPAAIISFYPGYTNWTFLHVKTPVSKLIVADAKRLRTPVFSMYSPKNMMDPVIVLFVAAYEDGQLPWLMSSMDPKLSGDQIKALMREYSATENVDAQIPPTYLAHGLKDKTVPFEQSIQLANQLEKYHVPNVLDLISGADHVFDYNVTYWEHHVLPAFNFAQKYMGAPAKRAVELNYE